MPFWTSTACWMRMGACSPTGAASSPFRKKEPPLTIGEARTMTEGDVTVNGSACVLSELKAMLDRMEQLGLLVDNVPAADWQLQVDGQTVPPLR